VCESTNPGSTTLPVQSTSITFLRFSFSHGSRRASFVVPTETIFPPRHKIAPSSMMPSFLSSKPRRGRVAEPALIVRSCLTFTNRTADTAGDLDLSRARKERVVYQGNPRRPSRESQPWKRLASHRHLYARLLRKFLRLVVPSIHVPDDAHARIRRQHALDALGHHVGTIGH